MFFWGGNAEGEAIHFCVLRTDFGLIGFILRLYFPPVIQVGTGFFIYGAIILASVLQQSRTNRIQRETQIYRPRYRSIDTQEEICSGELAHVIMEAHDQLTAVFRPRKASGAALTQT